MKTLYILSSNEMRKGAQIQAFQTCDKTFLIALSGRQDLVLLHIHVYEHFTLRTTLCHILNLSGRQLNNHYTTFFPVGMRNIQSLILSVNVPWIQTLRQNILYCTKRGGVGLISMPASQCSQGRDNFSPWSVCTSMGFQRK